MERELRRFRGQPLWIWVLVGVVTPAVSLMRALDDGIGETIAAGVGLVGIAVGLTLLAIDVRQQTRKRDRTSGNGSG